MHFFLFLSFFRSLSLSVCLSLDLSTSSVFLNLLSFFLLHSSVRCSSLSSPPQAVKLAANNFLDFVFFSRQKYSFHETPSQLSLSLSLSICFSPFLLSSYRSLHIFKNFQKFNHVLLKDGGVQKLKKNDKEEGEKGEDV